jgi:hypothetical protein
MRAKQVSVFAENRPGRLGNVLSTLAEVGVDVRALAIADSADFGIVRMILSDTAKGQAALKEAGFTLIVNDVLAVEVPDVPGGFYKAIVAPLSAAGVNIEYVYAFAEHPQEHALVVLKTTDLAKAEAIIG